MMTSRGKQKKYFIRLNCTGFQDFVVTAPNKELAIKEARSHFNCDGGGSEFCEFLETEEDVIRNNTDELATTPPKQEVEK